MVLPKIKRILRSSPSLLALHRGLPAIDVEQVMLLAAAHLRLIRLPSR
jgi:hypothetical protein